ncbi:MAG TPA: arsenite methyltransferase [bacterium]|nr:arsenite methyltransferase [bacterium]
MITPDTIRLKVREHYRDALISGSCGCGDCCGADSAADQSAVTSLVGPSLGCGTPVALADLRPGEVVVDLGSGAGGDVLRAAREVGPSGRSIGVDMTPEMVAAARANAARADLGHAEFRLGEIEHLPLPDGSADVIISNCVINLVPDKPRAFAEAYRVLRPGGRLVVSDMVSHGPLPDAIRADPAAWAACIAGAVSSEEYAAAIAGAGFESIAVLAAGDAVPGQIYSVTIRALKPVS